MVEKLPDLTEIAVERDVSAFGIARRWLKYGTCEGKGETEIHLRLTTTIKSEVAILIRGDINHDKSRVKCIVHVYIAILLIPPWGQSGSFVLAQNYNKEADSLLLNALTCVYKKANKAPAVEKFQFGSLGRVTCSEEKGLL